MKTITTRNTTIDLLKVVLAFIVVAAHMSPESGLTNYLGLFCYELRGFAVITIPSFFIISGYFLRNHINNKDYFFKYIKRILLLFIVWQVIYFPILIKAYLAHQLDFMRLIKDAFYGCGHLWYLIATAQATLLVYLVRNFSIKNKIIIIVLLYSMGCIFQYLIVCSNLKNNEVFTTFYAIIGTSRNFLFYAFPSILIGTLYDSWKIKILNLKYLFLPLFICLFIESYIYFNMSIDYFNLFIFSIPISMFVVCLAFEIKNIKQFKINSTLPLGIYLCHFYAIYFISGKIHENTVGFICIKYVLVCILSLIFWYLLDKLNKKLPYFF